MEAYSEAWAENYARLASASIPGRSGLYQLCASYLKRLPEQADILIIGTGTGEELIALADALPRANFVAIDPAEPMLAICRERLAQEDLNHRVKLYNSSLENFEAANKFDGATSILVSQHVQPDEAARQFFEKISARLKPGGLLYSADLHFHKDINSNLLTRLWQDNVVAAGLDVEMATGMLEKIRDEIQPRDEAVITGFLQNAGFTDIFMPFRSLMYGAWAAKKPKY